MRGPSGGPFHLFDPKSSGGWTIPVDNELAQKLIEQNIVAEAYPDLDGGVKTYRWTSS